SAPTTFCRRRPKSCSCATTVSRCSSTWSRRRVTARSSMTTSGSQAATTDLAPSVLARGGAVARLEPAAVVVGTACESEPLFEAERALLCAQPDRVVRGLGAALLATGARRGPFAARGGFSGWLRARPAPPPAPP